MSKYTVLLNGYIVWGQEEYWSTQIVGGWCCENVDESPVKIWKNWDKINHVIDGWLSNVMSDKRSNQNIIYNPASFSDLYDLLGLDYPVARLPSFPTVAEPKYCCRRKPWNSQAMWSKIAQPWHLPNPAWCCDPSGEVNCPKNPLYFVIVHGTKPSNI